MLALSIVSSLLGWPMWPAAILAWLATLRLFRQLPRASRRQAITLFAVGILLWVVALLRSTTYPLLNALVINQSLLIMFAGVSFLTMATPKTRNDSHEGSLLGTLFGAHFFGAAINLSVVFLFGERMQRQGRLTRSQALIVSRSFAAAATWSPFFVAMGVAVTYAPGMDYLELLPWGLLAAATLLLINWLDVARLRLPFNGYPLDKSALLLPCLLAVAVIGMHLLWPSLSIPLIIAIVAPPAAFLLIPQGERRERIHRQLTTGLQRLAPQFALFLAAGIISTGLAALLASFPGGLDLPVDHFTHWHAWIALAVMVAVAFVGIHPLISIATLAPLVAPLDPDATLLAMLYLMAWGLGTGSSPLSGSNLMIGACYQIEARQFLRWNLPYAVLGWVGCGGVMALHASFG